MLKGKKSLYILLPIVVFIWGAIIVQVVGAFSNDDPVINNTASITVAPVETKEREVFTIGVIERDPFLGTLYEPKKKIVQSKPVVKKPVLAWPSITYKGVVSGQGNKNAIYLIDINGTDQLMKVRQTVSDITLIRGGSNSIRLRYKGKSKDFKIAH